MRILGIDPGTEKLGYGVIDDDQPRPRYVECGVLTAPHDWTRARRIAAIGKELAAVLAEFKPDQVAIEEAFVGKFAAAVIGIGESRGAAIIVLDQVGIEPAGYAPSTVKATIGAGGRAKKPEVARVVKAILGLNRLPEPDASDALAIAICHRLKTAKVAGDSPDLATQS